MLHTYRNKTYIKSTLRNATHISKQELHKVDTKECYTHIETGIHKVDTKECYSHIESRVT